MTRKTPLRLTILHFSQRTLTDGLTFIWKSLPHYAISPTDGSPSVSLQLSQNQRLPIKHGDGVFKMSR